MFLCYLKRRIKNVYTCARDVNYNILVLKRIFPHVKIFFVLHTPFINKFNFPAHTVL